MAPGLRIVRPCTNCNDEWRGNAESIRVALQSQARAMVARCENTGIFRHEGALRAAAFDRIFCGSGRDIWRNADGRHAHAMLCGRRERRPFKAHALSTPRWCVESMLPRLPCVAQRNVARRNVRLSAHRSPPDCHLSHPLRARKQPRRGAARTPAANALNPPRLGRPPSIITCFQPISF
jgi:hypothetical protein